MIEPLSIEDEYHNEIELGHDVGESWPGKPALRIVASSDYGEYRAGCTLKGDNIIKLRDWLNRYIESNLPSTK